VSFYLFEHKMRISERKVRFALYRLKLERVSDCQNWDLGREDDLSVFLIYH